MISNSKLINVCFDLSAQRLMVKTTQKSDLPSSAIFSLIVFGKAWQLTKTLLPFTTILTDRKPITIDQSR